MKVAVLRFPGSNCDDDALHVLSRVMHAEARFAWHKDTSLGACEAVVIPGGFSYGDYLRAGAMAAHSHIMAALRQFGANGGLLRRRGLEPGGEGTGLPRLGSVRGEASRG